MNEEVFTIFDSAAKRFLQPFFAPTVEVGVRMFTQVLQNKDHQFARFPEDYTLFHTGTFDAVSGLIVPLDAPQSLGVALMFVERSSLKAVS